MLKEPFLFFVVAIVIAATPTITVAVSAEKMMSSRIILMNRIRFNTDFLMHSSR